MSPSDLKDEPMTVELGGKVRPFRYSFGSYALLAERWSRVNEPFEVISALFAKPTPDLTKEIVAALVDLVHAGLCSSDKTITRDEVADLIDLGNLAPVLTVVMLAQIRSVPKAKEGAKAVDPPTA